MSKEVIAVDVDDVLAQHIPAFVNFSNEHYGTSLEIKDYSERWGNLWGVDWDEVERRAKLFHDTHVSSFEAFTDADRVLLGLKSSRDLVIVTARPKHLIPATHEWLEEYYSGLFSDVHFVPIWEPDNTVSKADICKEIGADYLIDDLPKHCNIAAEVGIKALLFGDYVWRDDQVLVEGVERVNSWQEVAQYFEKRN